MRLTSHKIGNEFLWALGPESELRRSIIGKARHPGYRLAAYLIALTALCIYGVTAT